MADQPLTQRRPLTAYALFRMPEWLALLDALGVQADQRTQGLCIDTGDHVDSLVRITHRFDAGRRPEGVIEATSLQNRTWVELCPSDVPAAPAIGDPYVVQGDGK